MPAWTRMCNEKFWVPCNGSVLSQHLLTAVLHTCSLIYKQLRSDAYQSALGSRQSIAFVVFKIIFQAFAIKNMTTIAKVAIEKNMFQMFITFMFQIKPILLRYVTKT